VVEWHTNMRFAWQAKKSNGTGPVKQGFTHPMNLIMVAYNVLWWVPIILPFTGAIDFRTGFVALLVVTVIRLVANLVRNNVLDPEQAAAFPLRSP
jgi:hypothetical protein